MSHRVVIIGAGMGGLTAAVRLAGRGCRVLVLEARAEPGGLASGLIEDGLPFDAGPYILLDRPGLEWAFRELGLDLTEHVFLRRVEEIYEVSFPDGPPARFHAGLEETAAGLERSWPGSGRRYVRFVTSVRRVYDRLSPLLHAARPGPCHLLRGGAWRHVPFLLRSLGSVLAGTGLPAPVRDALAIWTHVAAQRVDEAPSPMAFVAALIHTTGAFYPVGGVGAIPRVLAAAAVKAGVEFRYGTRVRSIRCANGRVAGVETDLGESIAADAVVSNAGGVGTYLDLLEGTPPAVKERLRRLPLQSPGVCAYLAVRGEPRPPYLRFFLPEGEPCRLLVLPGVMDPDLGRDGWRPARLIGPMGHARAERDGPAGQWAYLERLLAEPWWQAHAGEFRVLAGRTPAEWGARFHLHRDSMNPVMTARFMRAGRLAHRSPYVRGLYLAGSATHPGQWVSFCAISGVLAADRVREDLR
jgi:phytoene dehydrogenase-like protein